MEILDKFKKRKEIRKELADRMDAKDYDSVKQILILEINSRNYIFVERIVRQRGNIQKEHLKEISDILKSASKPKFYQFYKILCYISLEQTLE